MDGYTKHTVEQVIAAIGEAHTKTAVAERLGCSRNTVLNYCRRWATVAAAFEQERACLVDLAEGGLRDALIEKQPWAISFTLRTLGKDEGYTERQEVTGKDGGPLVVQVVEQIVSSRTVND